MLREPALPTLASGMTLGRPRRCPTTWTGREASRCPHFRGSAGTCLGRYLATQRALVGPVVKKWIQTRRPPVARQFTRDTLLGLLGASGLWVLEEGLNQDQTPRSTIAGAVARSISWDQGFSQKHQSPHCSEDNEHSISLQLSFCHDDMPHSDPSRPEADGDIAAPTPMDEDGPAPARSSPPADEDAMMVEVAEAQGVAEGTAPAPKPPSPAAAETDDGVEIKQEPKNEVKLEDLFDDMDSSDDDFMNSNNPQNAQEPAP